MKLFQNWARVYEDLWFKSVVNGRTMDGQTDKDPSQKLTLSLRDR